jgi:hypothetical protein
MDDAYVQSSKAALKFFDASPSKGLSSDQVVVLRNKYGRNGKHENRRLGEILTRYSFARRSPNTTLGAYFGAVQGSAGADSTWISSTIICACSV